MKKQTFKVTNKVVSAPNSFYLLFESDKKRAISFILPIVNFTIEETEKEKMTLIFHQDMKQIADKVKELGGNITLNSDYTDDPTPKQSGGIVSLGFPLIRLQLKNLTIHGTNPLILTCKKKTDWKIAFNREQRSSLINIPEYTFIDKKFHLKDDYVLSKHYIIPIGFEKPLYVIVAVIGKQCFTAIEMTDMTSFYAQTKLIEYNEHKSKKATLKKYKELIERWSK